MLKAKDLFKYRQGLDATIPQKGGQKEFLPDGSWLQNKQVEKFNEERHRVLNEPRVVQNDIVKGQWNPERRLVSLQNESKHFWETMGFNENKQKWLYPEEALFLMETNTIEVWYQEVPLSIQEAYMLYLDDHVSPEYYQVYAYLRRQGFIVVRHQGKMNITEYERRMRLDKYKSKKERKMAKRKLQKDANNEIEGSPVKKIQMADCVEKVSPSQAEIEADAPTYGESTGLDNVDHQKMETTMLDDTAVEKDLLVSVQDNIPDSGETCMEKNVTADTDLSFESVELKKQKSKGSDRVSFGSSSWDFSEIIFPNFSCAENIVTVSRTDKQKFPADFDLVSETYTFEKSKYINTKKMKYEGSVQELEFSHDRSRMGQPKAGVKCKNWKEYKQEVQKARELWDRSTEFPHIYSEEVGPLVLPEDAFSTEAVLDKLSIIHEDVQEKSSRIDQSVPDLQPDFDVYGPNSKFKKNNPGIPDCRIIITKFDAELPDLKASTDLQSYLGDSAELLWGVVGGGNIAFYAFSDYKLPQDIFIG